MLREVRLDLADPTLGPRLDPRELEIVLDAVQGVAVVHGAMIVTAPDGRMSRTAYLAAAAFPTL
jgi:hypothetical protein